MPASEEGSLLYTISQAATLLGVSKRRAYQLASSDALPPGVVVRLGRSVRFSRSLLEAFLGAPGALPPARRDPNSEMRSE